MQPENGGLSVFAHEFGHDLGLPDLYDTSGNSGGASNSTEFWTLMSQSRGTAPGDPGIGDRPMPFGAWEKFQLGWLDYKTFRPGHTAKVVLRPGQSLSTRHYNGAIVVLPDKQVPLQLGDPCPTCGERFYWSQSGDDLDNTMTTAVANGGALTAKVRYSMEEGYDYAFLEYTNDGGATWTPLHTSKSYGGADGSGVNSSGDGISGESGGWVDLSATVPADAQGIRWRYLTDPAVALTGFEVDNITLDGTVIGDAESADDSWSLDGFVRTTGSDDVPYFNAYVIDNRQYVGRDKLLKHLYNFGFLDKADLQNKVEYLKYQPGALISYWDTSYTDNNVGDHPGHGEVLPVDAHPYFDHYPGTDDLVRTRILTRDSAFSLKRIPPEKAHYFSKRYTVDGYAAQPTFDDTLDWWFDNDEHGVGDHPGFYEPEWFGVDVPKTGTVITVKKVQKDKDIVLRISSKH
jgi:immune inhibitor A